MYFVSAYITWLSSSIGFTQCQQLVVVALKCLFITFEECNTNQFWKKLFWPSIEQRKYILILSSLVGLSCSILRWTCIWSQAWLNCCKHRIHSTYLVKHLFCKKTVCEMHRWRLFIFGFISWKTKQLNKRYLPQNNLRQKQLIEI